MVSRRLNKEEKGIRRRIRVVVFVVLLVWGAMVGRLVQLQWLDRDKLAARANRQRSYVESIPARPGDIIDRHGRLLATTVTVRSLYVVPSLIGDPRTICHQLAAVLELDAEGLASRISERREKHFLWIKRRLSDNEVARIRELKLKENLWGFREEYLRRYPQGLLAAHVIGLRDIDGHGRGGIEQKFDEVLRGRDGERSLVRDARGRVIEVHDTAVEAPQHGRSVVLTIDTVVQLYAERELDRVMAEHKPQSACTIVLDPRNGDLLACASRPGFDPNHPVNVPAAAWKNTSISAMYEPGSTFKPFIVAWALEQGLLKPNESFDCENGEYKMGRRVLHDHHPHGRLNVTDILVKSSNIGMAKIGQRLKNRELHRAVVEFGFGNKTGIELPGELAGVVRPLDKWTPYSMGSVPMGHEIAVTPLQLIGAHAALANGGRLVTPRILLPFSEIESSEIESRGESRPSRSRVVTQTVRADVARWIVEGPLTETIRRGTGRNAQLKNYEVFGKTGTAQKVDPQTGQISQKLHVSSFVCGGPVDDPRVLVLVLVDEPFGGGSQFGGTIAAPAAARILEQTLAHLRVAPLQKKLRSAKR